MAQTNESQEQVTINVETLQPVTRTLMTIGALPTSYLISMTYEEQLLWLQNYLIQTVIPAINNNAEATEEVQDIVMRLQDYINTQFSELNLQEYIDNKLDEMLESGVFENILMDYVQLTKVYDTYNDMISDASTFTNGMKIKTLGYHSINDGGGADYVVTNIQSDTKYQISIGTNLWLEMIIIDSVNVKQFGAYGDDTHEDDDYFQNAIAFCRDNNLILYAPTGIGTYKLTTQIDFRSLNIKIDGILDNSLAIIVGGDAKNQGDFDININICNDVNIIGLKNSRLNIIKCNRLSLIADASIESDSSIAYNTINIIRCTGILLTGSNNGWINENKFNIKRCVGDLTITGDGTYYHNNNIFHNICIEGSSNKIQIDYGHNNYITYRGEQDPQVILREDRRVYANLIQPTYATSVSNMIRASQFNPLKTLNIISPSYLPSYQIKNVLDINTKNFLNTNCNIFLEEDGKLHGSWAYEFETGDIEFNEAFVLYLKCSDSSQRVYITCKDINGNNVPGEIISGILAYDENDKVYKTNNNVNGGVIHFIPTDEVKTINIQVRTGNSVSFDYILLQLIVPFTSNFNLYNLRDTHRRMSTTPSLTNNAVWKAGDIIYNVETNLNNGIFCWICVTDGTGSNSVWRKVETTAIQ